MTKKKPTIFETAPVAKSLAKPPRPSIGFGNNLDVVVLLSLVSKAIENFVKPLRKEFDEKVVMPYFITTGLKEKTKPVNPDIFGDLKDDNEAPINTALIQLLKKDSRADMGNDLATLLQVHKIPFDTLPMQEKCYRFNPKYTDDQAVLELLSKALLKIKGLPEDIIEVVPEVSRRVVTDDTINAIFKMDSSTPDRLETITELLASTTNIKFAPKTKAKTVFDIIAMLEELKVEIKLEGKHEK